MKNTSKLNLLILAGIVALGSCEKPKAAAVTNPLVAAILAAPVGSAATSIKAAHGTAKPGEEVTLTGVVMGSEKPFVEGRAAFILGDPAELSACNLKPGDQCETPWDVCCETREDILGATVTVQILTPEGRVLAAELEGTGGLAKLAKLTVTGKVAESSAPEAVVINASAIRVEK
jgi:hypothetical protein